MMVQNIESQLKRFVLINEIFRNGNYEDFCLLSYSAV
jgi:hypothetical protein